MKILRKIKNKFKRQQKIDYSKIKVRQDDTFLVSYPKSGNTWMRFLLSSLKNENEVSYKNLEEHIPSIYRSFNKLDSYKSPRIIKSHHTHFDIYPKSIYIVRDGRDALASYYHFYKDLRNFEKPFTDFYHYIQENDEYPYWTDHVNSFLEFRKQYPERCLLIRYEDLKTDIHNVLPKVCDFCNIKTTSDQINAAIQKADFSKLKQKHGGGKGVLIDNKKVNFFRKGVVGDWKTYFSEQDLLHFRQHNKQLLSQLAYDR